MSLIKTLRTDYSQSRFWRDLLASMAVLIVLVPQAIAYGLLAGFPAESGLYTAIVALIIYPFFATSKQLSVGPVALGAIILYSGLSQFPELATEDYIRYGLIVCLMSGIIQILFAVMRMGILVNFLSNPVISGFISAAAIIIIINQSNVLLGITFEKTNNTILDAYYTLKNFLSIHLTTALIGVGSVLTILISRKFIKKIPSALIVFVLASLLIFILQKFTKYNTPIVGDLPSGLPVPKLFSFTFAEVKSLLPLSLVIALISFIDSSAIAKSLAISSQDHRVDANKELWGLGLAKIVSSFFMGIPSSGSFARSSMARDTKSTSQLTSWLAAIILIVIVLFLTPLFKFGPKAMLAAIIITSVAKLIDIQKMKDLYRLDIRDFYALMACFFVTLIVGIQEGIIAGVVISLFLILWKNMRPHYAILGKLQEHDVYRNINRYDSAIHDEATLIFRFDDDLYFANSDHFYESITRELEKNQNTEILIMDMSAIAHIDSTGFDTLRLISKNLKGMNVKWKFASLKGPVRDLFDHYGYEEIISPEDCHFSIDSALESK